MSDTELQNSPASDPHNAPEAVGPAVEADSQAPRPARWIALGVGAVVFGLIAVLAVAAPGGNEETTTSALLGRAAPDTAGPTIGGGSFDLADHRGNWVAVNFFATWCPGCVNEHDDLVAFDRWARERGDVELVAVVFNDPPEQVASFFDQRGGGWPVINNPQVPVAYEVKQIPETFLIGPTGQVVYHAAGEVTADQLIEAIDSMETGS